MVRRRLDELAASLVVLAVLAGVSAAVAEPWRDDGTASSPVDRYLHVRDGSASLARVEDGDGEPLGWNASTVEVVPGVQAIAATPDDFRQSLNRLFRREGEDELGLDELRDRVRDARVVRVMARRLRTDGSPPTTSVTLSVVRADGMYLLGFEDSGSGARVFDPPPKLLSGDPTKGDRWETEGTLQGTPFRIAGEVTEVARRRTGLGTFDDCITVTSELSFGESAGDGFDRYCTGVGVVESASVVDGSEERFVTVSTDERQSAERPALPPGPAAKEEVGPGDPASWALTKIGGVQAFFGSPRPSVLPEWLGGDPPVVVVADEVTGNLTAFDAGQSAGTVRWRVHTAGVVYGPPRHDAERGRVYAGATDRRVYAFDDRGLFLWSAATGDNVATRPVVAGDTVVVGSEDGVVYGLDPGTGARRWTHDAGPPVAASPAEAAGVVAVADDEGTVVGLDARTGDTRWTHGTGEGVEAGITVARVGGDRWFVVATRGGSLVALDARTGAVGWEADAGGDVHADPVVLGDVVVVTTLDGDLVAHGLRAGARRWRHRGGYVGGADQASGVVVAVTRGGRVDAVDATGDIVRSWDAGEAGGRHPFVLGARAGGDAVWLADERGGLWRLGAGAIAVPFHVAWLAAADDPPLAGLPVATSTVPWRDRVVVLDLAGAVAALDPATGVGEALGSLDLENPVLVDPVVAGDTLVLDTVGAVTAFDLPSLAVRWSAPYDGTVTRPPLVAGDTVVVVSTTEVAAVVSAFDLDTGEPRWQGTGKGLPWGHGAAASPDGSVVYAGNPVVAYDAATGDERWRSSVTGALGGLARSRDGDHVYVATLDDDGLTGGLAAIDAGDGSVAWTVDAAPIDQFDRLLVPGTGDVVTVGGATGEVVATDPGDGEEVWRTSLPSARLGNGTVIDGRIWFALQDGDVVALDAASGRPVVSFEALPVDISAFAAYQRPVAAGDRILVSAGLVVYALAEGPG